MPRAKTSIKDEYPQWLRGEVTESSVNTYTETHIAAPNLTEAGYIMEIIKVFIELQTSDDTFLAAGDGIRCHLSDRSFAAMPHINDAGVIIGDRIEFEVETSGGGVNYSVKEVDFAACGHGVLFAKKSFYFAVQGVSMPATGTFRWAMLYRLVKVSSEELIGLMSD